MRTSDRVLAEKYVLISEETQKGVSQQEISEDLFKLNKAIRDLINNNQTGNELFTAYTDLLLSLLNSTDTNVVKAVTSALNQDQSIQNDNVKPSPTVQTSEEDEAIGNANDNKNGIVGNAW